MILNKIYDFKKDFYLNNFIIYGNYYLKIHLIDKLF
jgi:hypothetical protein